MVLLRTKHTLEEYKSYHFQLDQNFQRKKIQKFENQTPWQEIARSNVGQLEDGACIRSRGLYLDINVKKGIPRNSH